eukprot:2293586-Pleurochrysis_carterae.AAC.1
MPSWGARPSQGRARALQSGRGDSRACPSLCPFARAPLRSSASLAPCTIFTYAAIACFHVLGRKLLQLPLRRLLALAGEILVLLVKVCARPDAHRLAYLHRRQHGGVLLRREQRVEAANVVPLRLAVNLALHSKRLHRVTRHVARDRLVNINTRWHIAAIFGAVGRVFAQKCMHN